MYISLLWLKAASNGTWEYLHRPALKYESDFEFCNIIPVTCTLGGKANLGIIEPYGNKTGK